MPSAGHSSCPLTLIRSRTPIHHSMETPKAGCAQRAIHSRSYPSVPSSGLTSMESQIPNLWSSPTVTPRVLDSMQTSFKAGRIRQLCSNHLRLALTIIIVHGDHLELQTDQSHIRHHEIRRRRRSLRRKLG